MNERARAREERITQDTLSLIDYSSRVIGAVESGNWYYAADKLHHLADAVAALQRDVDQRHATELAQVDGGRVWASVTRQLGAGGCWLGRAILAWKNSQRGGPR